MKRNDFFFHGSAMSKTHSISHSIQILTIHPRPSNYLNKSLTRLKNIFFETLCKEFLSTKLDNVSTAFSVDQLGQTHFSY